METAPLTDEIRRGRNLVILVIAVLLGASILAILAFQLRFGTARTASQIIRLAMAGGLCALVYDGRNWARWVLIVLLYSGGVYGILRAIRLGSRGDTLLLLVGLGLLYYAMGGILHFSTSVKAFIKDQTKRRSRGSGEHFPPAGR